LRENDTVFLHSPGTCTECDEAWASIDAPAMLPASGTVAPG
jgi:hypothetical protein